MAATKPRANDWEKAFNIASGFADSATVLHRESARVLSGPGQTVQVPFLIPAVVCSAFSVELFIKCLVMVEGGKAPQRHDLKMLFSRLTPDSRAAIAQRFDELIAASPTAQAIKAQFPNVLLALDDVLDTVDRVFEHWRYAYEGQAGSVYGLGELGQAVRERILELRGAA
jgi:hypothetical protein